MEFDHDVHAAADTFADGFERSERRLEFGLRDVETAVGFGGDVEGPDLHGGDALGEKRFGEIGRAGEKSVEIIEAGDVAWFRLRDAPVGGGLGFGASHVIRTGAGVVSADAIASAASEHLNDASVDRLAEEIPKREIDGGSGAGFDAGGTEAEIRDEVA